MSFVLLVRHAEPEGDYAHRFLGRADPGLSDAGRAAAEARGAEFAALGVPVVIASPARRALETARRMFPGLVPEPLRDAAELDFGYLEGLTVVEAERLYPEAASYFRRRPLDASPFGGENWADLRRRARELVARLDERSPCAVVSHRYLIAAVCEELFGAHAVAPLNYCGSVLVRRDADGAWRPERG